MSVLYGKGAEALKKFDVVIFDFDGVILQSNLVKEQAFQRVFENTGLEGQKIVASYHKENLGVPRDIKISHLYKVLYDRSIEPLELIHLCERFAKITLEQLSSPKYLIQETVDFISVARVMQRLYIASAALESDVRYLCQVHEIDRYFCSINGSPESKISIVKRICEENPAASVALVGDSMHDLAAAEANNVDFYGYNNIHLMNGCSYIKAF